MMILLNAIEKEKTIGKKQWEIFLQLLAPFAPHITDELWEKLGHSESIHISQWPVADESKIIQGIAHVAVQVNGKVRATIEISPEAGESEALAAARADQNVQKWLALGKEVKAVYVPGKVINFVVQQI